jgi:hypothetical protein
MAEEPTIQWPKNIQYNGRRTYNTMAEENGPQDKQLSTKNKIQQQQLN